MSALEGRLLDKGVTRSRRFHPSGSADRVRRGFVPEPRNLTVRWRDVFAAPLETRARVEDALAQPDCLVAEGYYRPDRRDACAAADLATLGILHEACVPFLGRDAYADWEGEWAREFERLVEEVPDQGDVYNRRRSILEEARIHFAWRLQKCRAVPPDALTPLAALPTPPPHYDNPDWHQGYAMIRAALRLGDDWALAHMIRVTPDDFDRWFAEHDGAQESRLEYGITDGPLYRDISDPNALLIHLDVEDMDRAPGLVSRSAAQGRRSARRSG